MTLFRWSPLGELPGAFDRPRLADRRVAPSSVPPVDIFESREHYEVEMELPAVAPTDVAVEVQDGVLTVSGEHRGRQPRHTDEAAETVRVHRRERRPGRFSRSFRLPRDADVDAISATARDGILRLTLPRRTEVQGRRVAVRAA